MFPGFFTWLAAFLPEDSVLTPLAAEDFLQYAG
jgi:hypothetical protein